MPEVDKVICMDHRGSCCNNNNNDMLPLMAMMNGGMGMNQWMNNPFAYMMMMAWERNYNNGNCNNSQAIELSNQMEAMRSQLQDNQNIALLNSAIGDGFNRNDFALSQLAQNLGVDFNSLQRCCCDVQAAIQQVGGQIGFSAERVINAANMGDCRVIEALKDCCCQTKQLVQEMGYETRLGLKDVGFGVERGICGLSREVQFGFDRTNTGLERGFSALGFQASQDKCDIIAAGKDNTQRIIDTLNNHWNSEQALALQDEKFKNSQLQQNIYLRDLVQGRNYGGCGCNNNIGCGCGL